jgi:Fic family protein
MTPPFTVTPEILSTVVRVTQKTTTLTGEKERNLHLRKQGRLKAVQSSLAIERNSLTLEQVTAVVDGQRILGSPREIHEVQRAFQAYEQAFDKNPFSISDFLEMHGLMMAGLVEPAGAFRAGDVGIYNETGQLMHVGARPQFVPALVKELFDWARETDYPTLIVSAVVQFELEVIHPFSDGNGRMGRLWQNVILAKWEPIFEWLPIETIIHARQAEYYEVLGQCDAANDSTAFITFMLTSIEQALDEFEETATETCAVQKLPLQVVRQLTDREQVFVNAIADAWDSEQGGIGLGMAVSMSGLPAGTARRYLLKLVDLGVLGTTGGNRNRRYYLLDKKETKPDR